MNGLHTPPTPPNSNTPNAVPAGETSQIPNAMPAGDTSQMPSAMPMGDTSQMPNVAPVGGYVPAPNAQGLNQPGVDPGELAAIQNLEERRKQTKRRRMIKIIIAVAVVVALISSCTVGNAIMSVSSKMNSKPTTAEVTKETITTTVQASGTLTPGSRVSVTPEVSGVIEEVRVAEGQHVEAGDVLLTLKNTELDKSIGDATSALERAQNGVNSAQASVDSAYSAYNDAINAYNSAVDAANQAAANAENVANQAYDEAYNAAVAAIPSSATEAERNKLLAEAREAAQAAYNVAFESATKADPGSFDHSSYLSAIDAANSAKDSAEESLKDAQRNYDYAVEEADKRTVKAPVSGTVLDLKAQAGAAVGGAKGGTSTVSNDSLMQIANLNSLSVDVEVNEVDISNVAVGERANVTFTAIPDLTINGTVTSVASVASNSGSSENTGGGTMGGGIVTYKVSTVLNDVDPRLKPGMTANVSIVTNEIPNAIVVPSTAVTEDENGTTVQVVTDEKTLAAETRQITIGERSGAQVVVTSGLSEGDIVLINTTPADGSSTSSSSSTSR